jgi:hypothetical protein
VATTDLIIDDSAPLSFLAQGRRTDLRPADRSWMAPTWVDEENARRLERYKFLSALIGTVGRYYQHGASETERKERREYGDAALLVEAALNALIGEDVTIAVDDSEKNDAAAARLAELEDWADKEGLVEKLFEGEWDAIGLGDTVYTLGWSNRKGRVRLRVYNPGFCFPVLGDNQDDDFPERYHLGWEFEETKADGTKVTKVRRITWSLEAPEGATDPTCLLSEGVWEFDALSDRKQFDFDESAAVWEVNEDGDEVHDLDLGIDFIPVLHVPNTPASQTHFGKSILLYVVQLLWDIHGLDTDRDKAAKTTGTPILGIDQAAPVADPTPPTGGVSGWLAEAGERLMPDKPAPPEIQVRPGMAIFGKISSVDMSAGLAALDKHSEELRSLLSVNAQIPGEVLGRASQVDMSGIRFALAFGPLTRLVRKMRLVRDRKYPLMMKMQQRITIAHGGFAGDTTEHKARIQFGAFLPTDRKAIIDQILALLEAQIITPATALQLLVDEGIVDVDVDEEMKALDKLAADAASRMLRQMAGADDDKDETQRDGDGDGVVPE